MLARDGEERALDLSLLAIAAAALVQLAPLPPALSSWLSPHAEELRRALSLGDAAPAGWRPLTIDVRDTAWGGLVALGAVALFFAARELFAWTGVRQTLRGVAAIGFAAAAVAIAQAATAGRMIYWRFPTEYEGPFPFGPFVNRNHYATWVIMALPLCVGYIAARSGHRSDHYHHSRRHLRTRLAQVADGRMLWLTVAGTMMLASLLLSASRSGILGLAAAGLLTLLATRGRTERRGSRGLLAVVAVMVVVAFVRADVPRLADRFGHAGSDVQARMRIWQDTAPLVRDFWLAGTGEGTFRTAMFVYQRSDRDVQFNQAHNHYVQAAAEGGLLLVVPIICGLWAVARVGAIRMAGEPAGAFWIRAGAACGLLAVALQSVWEAGLVMPANAALAAVLAAILVHERVPADGVV